MATFVAFPRSGMRVCGSCSACCARLPISAPAVGQPVKPAGTACPHLCSRGCRIYPRRPELCIDFRCVWLRDRSWDQAWRPDRSGLLCLREEIEVGLPAAAVYEILPGALQEPTADEVIAALKQRTLAVVLVDSREHRRCLLSDRFVHPAEPVPSRPHFLRRLNPQPSRREAGS